MNGLGKESKTGLSSVWSSYSWGLHLELTVYE